MGNVKEINLEEIDIIPQNGCVLCRRVSGNVKVECGDLIYDKPQIPVYEILKTSKPTLEDLDVGSHIICNSSGTEVCCGEDSLWIFKPENIVAKIRQS